MLAYTHLLNEVEIKQIKRFIFIQHTVKLDTNGNKRTTLTVLAEVNFNNRADYIVNVSTEASVLIGDKYNKNTSHVYHQGSLRDFAFKLWSKLGEPSIPDTFIDW